MEKQRNMLIGKWEVEGIYEYLKDESKWIYIDKYKPGSVIWNFGENRKLNAYLDGEPDYETKYLYKSDQNKLLITQSYLECLNIRNIKHIDYYRVDIISSGEIWLYDLDDVDKEPDDYWLALKMVKLYNYN